MYRSRPRSYAKPPKGEGKLTHRRAKTTYKRELHICDRCWFESQWTRKVELFELLYRQTDRLEMFSYLYLLPSGQKTLRVHIEVLLRSRVEIQVDDSAQIRVVPGSGSNLAPSEAGHGQGRVPLGRGQASTCSRVCVSARQTHRLGSQIYSATAANRRQGD